MRTVESAVHTAFIFNTHLDFTELLRFALNELGVATSALDRLTLMAQLNDYLIAQLNNNHIVSLLVDEDQDLNDEMLEELRLLSNLETDRAKLIQIVLMGQPELERKLDQPELRQLKQRVAVRCRLAPLKGDEVAPYINSRLQTVGYKGKELFDPSSIEKIALYSKGIPRLINVICDNALLIAYATSQSQISPKIVDEVARDLKLVERTQVNAPEEEKPTSREAPYDGERWRSEVEEFPAALQPLPHQLDHKRGWAGAGIAVVLGLIILAGTVLYSRQSGSLAALGVSIDGLVPVHWKNRPQSQAPGDNTQGEIAQLDVPHLQGAASQRSEFLPIVPIGDGITGPARRDSSKSESSGSIEVQSPKSETPPASADPNPQTDAKAKPTERIYRVSDFSFVRDK